MTDFTSTEIKISGEPFKLTREGPERFLVYSPTRGITFQAKDTAGLERALSAIVQTGAPGIQRSQDIIERLRYIRDVSNVTKTAVTVHIKVQEVLADEPTKTQLETMDYAQAKALVKKALEEAGIISPPAEDHNGAVPQIAITIREIRAAEIIGDSSPNTAI